jgi:hypothetical protein
VQAVAGNAEADEAADSPEEAEEAEAPDLD